VPVEIAFNLSFLLVLVLILQPRQLLLRQRFHLYLIAYGLFRLGHETVRDTPRILGPWSGYQLLALALVGFGIERFWRYSRAQVLRLPPHNPQSR
jgi:phosphatidylglycerol---prolipoprotein diacylglyceryl transferase